MHPPFEKGNQLWKLRSKHGRDKIFSSPEQLWEAAAEYFKWCDDNPWQKQNWVGKDGHEVMADLPRPYTITGLCIYIGIDVVTYRSYGKDEGKRDFFTIFARIDQIIKTHKFEGAAVGIFKENIISRDLGLRDNTDVTTDGQSFNITVTK